MFRDRTEPTLFRAGTVPETVPVRSLVGVRPSTSCTQHFVVQCQQRLYNKNSVFVQFQLLIFRFILVFFHFFTIVIVNRIKFYPLSSKDN